uniref:Uncharacterized protein n=1 Tax=Steinernema glaseri TaxID=37863 RepID=A0A1I7YLD7_9BILA
MWFAPISRFQCHGRYGEIPELLEKAIMNEIAELNQERLAVLAEINRIQNDIEDSDPSDDDSDVNFGGAPHQRVHQLAVFPGFLDICLFACIPKDMFRFVLPLISKHTSALTMLNDRFGRPRDASGRPSCYLL